MAGVDHDTARALVVREGWLLDRQQWDKWLELYTEDAEYWLPCWKEDETLTSDPLREISLIYYGTREGLEDRVFRIRTGQSLASTPLPRTSHIIQCVYTETSEDGSVIVESNWVTHSYRLETQNQFFGTQTHRFVRVGDELRISSRKIVVMNDKLPCPLDIYSV
jgi:3-phenylpropionate/cinnamic acid dioxygenase small subunit